MERATTKILRLLLGICLIGGLPACSGNDRGNAALGVLNLVTPGSAYEMTADVAFGSDQRQRMNVFRPVSPSDNAKLVVFVYGGAWREGVKEDYSYVAQTLAGQGHWVVIPDYRLFPEVQFPAFVEDVAEAVKALPEALQSVPQTQNLLGEGSEPLEVVLMGHSSGAYNVSVVAANPERWLGENPGVVVSGFIGLSGPYDLPLDHRDVVNVFESIIDVPKPANPALPIPQITTKHPRALLVHGTGDRRVVPRHTEQYAAKLAQLDVAHDVLWLEGDGHAAPVTGLSTVLPGDDQVLNAVLRFLAE